MFQTDRREWAVLGLIALGWALLVAPVLHRETHAHGHSHSHGPLKSLPGEQGHGTASVEHQLAFDSAPMMAVRVFISTDATWERELVPCAPEVVEVWSSAQAQAPPV